MTSHKYSRIKVESWEDDSFCPSVSITKIRSMLKHDTGEFCALCKSILCVVLKDSICRLTLTGDIES